MKASFVWGTSVILGMFLWSLSAYGQGALSPPGAPAPTMVSLDEISTSIAAVSQRVDFADGEIDVLTLPGDAFSDHVISQSGSYYLSREIISGGKSGIKITASNVTLNLNGFYLQGFVNSGGGVIVASNAQCVAIRNGFIRWYNVGISLGSHNQAENVVVYGSQDTGISAVSNCVLKNCRTIDIGKLGITPIGIGYSLGKNNTLTGCGALGNLNVGFSPGSSNQFFQCFAFDNSQNGFSDYGGSFFSACVARNNGVHGFFLNSYARVESCMSTGNGIDGFLMDSHCQIRSSIASENGGYGFRVVNSSSFMECTATKNELWGFHSITGCSFIDCQASGNASGFYTSSDGLIQGCTAERNNLASDCVGIRVGAGSLVEDCMVAANQSTNALPASTDGIGIEATVATIRGCTVMYNSGDGIRVGSNSRVENNHCRANGRLDGDGAGIHATSTDNLITDNLCQDNDRGYDIDASGNILVRNYADSNTLNWDVAANNAALVVAATTSGAISGDSGGGSVGSTDPNANYTY